MDIPLQPGERLDDLQYKGLYIIQRADAFRFGTDEVALSDFARFRSGDRAIDLGTGNGILPILMAARNPRVRFDAVERQADIARLAQRNMALNHMDDRITVREMDWTDAPARLGKGIYQHVVCNPPYTRAGAGAPPEVETTRLSKQETDGGINGLLLIATKLLQNKGRISLVYPAPRAPELMCVMRDNGLTPKRLTCVMPSARHAPKIILVEGVKGAKDGLAWLAPLILQNEDGTPTDAYRRLYHMPPYQE